jgi:autotransporter-associated beta strand protein
LLRLDGGISGTVQSIASLSGAGDVLFVVSAGDQLIVGLDNSSTTFSGDTSGGGALTKTGSGTLTVSGRLNHGSTFVQQGTLHLEDAESTGFVSLQSGGTLSGSGLNRGRIFGDIGSFVSATGGFASFGDATTTSGFFHEGSLDVNTSTTLLLDADKAELGSSTTLAGGGRLVTLNGAQIGTGESLTASGSATIDGNFTNGGTVNGPAGGDQLTFTDDVDGDGNYTGNILFSDGFSPGASPAQISLENVEFDSSSELLIELGGYVPGDDHDQLVVSGDVVLGGSLVVETLGLFTLDSFDQFTIIDVTTGTLSGTFAGLAEGALVPIAGSIPATISYVGGTGNDVVLTGVPEPATCSLGWPLVTALLWRRSRKTRCVG